ncbi:MAG: hypothetical protein RIA69_17745 [Cyclobacteriaceae bacterium]
MGLLNSITDHFSKAEFSVAPNKKLKTISKDFKEKFGLTLIFYKGKKLAEPSLTLKQLNDKTSKDVTTSGESLKIKASTKVGEAENMFNSVFGVTVQIKDEAGKKLVPNEVTIGKAARGEY